MIFAIYHVDRLDAVADRDLYRSAYLAYPAPFATAILCAGAL